MRHLISVFKTTITGGALFLLPLVVVIILLTKAYHILSVVAHPISEWIKVDFLGMDGSMIITVLLILLLCFLSGLFFRSKIIKRRIQALESRLLVNVPGYALLKSIASDALGIKDEHGMSPVLVRDGEGWLLGFLCEEGPRHSIVFMPDAPRHDAGEIRLVPTTDIKPLQVNASQFAKIIKAYGKGALSWVDQD